MDQNHPKNQNTENMTVASQSSSPKVSEINDQQITFSELIDTGKGLGNYELNKNYDSNYFANIALQRVIKHKDNLLKVNPHDKESFDESLISL